jgi:hypothetical protein
MEVTKMTKHVKKHFLLSTALFSLLLISCLYSSLARPVYAAETDIENKTMAILDEVIAINTAEYTPRLNSLLDNQFRSLAQKESDIILASSEGRLRVTSSFVNNNLRRIYLSDFEGKFSVEQPAAYTVDLAKGFLERYQIYAGDSFYGELASMLDDVDAAKNTTKSVGNIRLKVSNFDQIIVDYVWRYIDENGIVARSKSVSLSYDRGRLKGFSNNWPFYKVAGTPKISGEEATAIAIEASKTYSYTVTTDNGTSTVTGFEIAPESLGHEVLSYLNFPNQTLARGGDSFTLYPSWYVPIGFKKSYPGAVTGITVTIWADTGEISSTNKMVVNFAPATSADEEESTISSTNEQVITDGLDQNLTMLAVPIVVTAFFSVFGVAVIGGKKFKFAGSKKLFPRFGGTLLCGIILFSVIVVAAPKVAASPTIPNSKSRIYAAFDTYPSQIDSEEAAANWTCEQIDAAFEASGYSSDNLAGGGTLKDDVLDNAQHDEDEYDRVAVFHFGHQSSPNFAYQDNVADDITWADLQAHIDSNKHVFVFMWVCEQARGPSYGIPANWTNNQYMTSDGFRDADGGGQCYIGFDGISPQIGNESGTFENQITGPVKYFIKYFYDYALRSSRTVNQALDWASHDFFEDWYTQSILFGEDGERYSAWWPGGGGKAKGYYPGRMRVFGDGDMWLFQPKITILAGSGGTTNPIPGTYWLTMGADVHVVADPDDEYYLDYWLLDGERAGSLPAIDVSMESDHTLKAIFAPWRFCLTIFAGPGGTTDPSPGISCYLMGTTVEVTAIPDVEHDFDYWIIDEIPNPIYEQTLYAPMYSDHTLEAHFIQKYRLTIQSSYGGHTVPSAGEYYYQSGSYTEVTAYVDYPENWKWSHWMRDGQDYSDDETVSFQMYSDHTLKPIFEYYEQYCLTIQNSYGGHTVPSAGEYYYPEGEYAEVTAYVDYPENWEWSHWMRDGQDYSDDETVSFQMYSDHTLKPIFEYDPQIEYHDLTVEYFAFFWGQFIHMAGYTTNLPEDYYTFTAPSTVYGLDFVCWYYEGNYYYDQTITIFLDSDQYLAAIYVPS